MASNDSGSKYDKICVTIITLNDVLVGVFCKSWWKCMIGIFFMKKQDILMYREKSKALINLYCFDAWKPHFVFEYEKYIIYNFIFHIEYNKYKYFI